MSPNYPTVLKNQERCWCWIGSRDPSAVTRAPKIKKMIVPNIADEITVMPKMKAPKIR